MPSFRYTALTPAGDRVAGAIAGATEQAVLAELETRRLTPVSLAEHETRRRSRRSRVSTRAIATAYAQTADLLRAGVPLLRALKLLGSQRSQPRIAAVFTELADAVAQGTELADAMAVRPDVFARIHVAMVRAGEKGGFLESVLARLGQFLRAQADLKSKIVGNLIYPAVLVVFGALALGLVFGVFIPMFRPIFSKLELNALTRAVFAVSDLIAYAGAYILAVLIVGAVALWRASKRPSVRARLSRLRAGAPVLGPLVRSVAVARFCRVLGTLLANSIPLLAAMQIARDAAGDAVLEEAIDAATEAVRQGEGLARPLGESGLFPPDIVEMIAVGESANNLDTVLVTIAETAEERVDRMLTAGVKLVEPVMLLALAGVIGLVAMALILPMTQISQAV